MATPYLTTKEARAVARRIEKLGLLEPSLLVQLLPVCLEGYAGVNYVLRYYANEYAEEPLALVHFMPGKRGGKSAAFIDQLQEATDIKWWAFFRNENLLSFMPTTANTRRAKLRALLE